MKVSFVCPTMESRKGWLPKAVACYHSQEWPDKELIIVRDEGKSIGEKRNIGCDQATGEVICQLDDDDISYPNRIGDQVARLLVLRMSVTGYHSIKFTDGNRWWKYHGTPDFAFDTSLCYFRSFWMRHPFPHINDGLEMEFRNAAIREKVFVSSDGSDFMHATIHSGNTGARVMTPGNTTWEELRA